MDIAIYITLGFIASGYALFLNTKIGRGFASEYTWASVVIGTFLVLAAAWFLIPQSEWIKVFIAFVVSGIPMIARSLINKIKPPAPPTSAKKKRTRFSELEI